MGPAVDWPVEEDETWSQATRFMRLRDPLLYITLAPIVNIAAPA